MNINNGKTGIIDIPGALHSTGGDGDNQIGGVVAYTGDIYDDRLNKNQRDINKEIENSKIPLKSNSTYPTSIKAVGKEDTNEIKADEVIVLGVNTVGDQTRSFGWGSGYQGLWLTGSNGTYTVRLGNTSDITGYTAVLEAMAATCVNTYVLSSGSVHTKVTKITNATFANNVLTITTEDDLGTLNDKKYCYQNITGWGNFCIGNFQNSGRQNIAIGTGCFSTGDFSINIGKQNGNLSNNSVIVGDYNTNKSNMSSIVGNDNSIDRSLYSGVFGEYNRINAYNGANPSYVIGYDNVINQNVSGEILGKHNTLSYNGIVVGDYNKEYVSNDDSVKNFFTISKGTANNARINYFEQKANGDLYVFGIGGFNGTNSDVNTTKSLQGKINDLQTQIDNVNTSNFYTKSEIDTQNVVISTALNDLNDKVDNNESAINNLNDNVNSLQETVDELNEKAIKLNEYDEVNVTYPENEEREGYVLCNLAKDNERIIQDFADSDFEDSDFADSVRDGNFYIATNIGNDGISEDEFNGYILDEEITNINDSNDKSTILSWFKLNDYWVLETESELTASNNLYSGLGYYNKQRMVTPFRLESDGSLYLMNVGGYNGDVSTTHKSQSLQEVIDSNLSLLDSDNNLLINSKSEVESTATDSLIGGIATVGKGAYAFGFGGNAQKVYVSGNASDGYQLQVNVTSSFALTNYIRPIFESIYKNTYLLDANTYEKVAKITAVTPNIDD